MTPACRHCGREIVWLGPGKTTAKTNGWAHTDVDGNKLCEACEVDPVTLEDKRGTTWATPVAS